MNNMVQCMDSNKLRCQKDKQLGSAGYVCWVWVWFGHGLAICLSFRLDVPMPSMFVSKFFASQEVKHRFYSTSWPIEPLRGMQTRCL